MVSARRASRLAPLASLLLAACASTEAPQTPRSPPSARPAHFAGTPLAPPVFADPQRAEKIARAIPEIERFLAAEVERLSLPGAAFGLVVDGALAFQKTYGFADIEQKTPVTPDSAFRIASITKSFTAVTILQLRDEGKLGLDDPAERHVPELAALAYPTRDAALITLRQLLSHGGGFPEDNPWGDRQLAMPEADFSRFLSSGKIPFSTAPNTAYEYANLGFAILGRAVTNASGVDYAEFLRSRLLAPLGMHSTALDERELKKGALARGYRREGASFVPEPNLPHGAFGAMGGLFSTLNDMAKYVAFHLSAWPARDEPDRGPLRRSSLREMHQGGRPMDMRVSPGLDDQRPSAWSGSYGFGLSAFETCELIHGISHTGGLPGYGSVITFLPEYGVGFIGLSNVTYASMSRLGREVLRKLRDAGAIAPRAHVPSADLLNARGAVSRLLATWSDAEAEASFADSLYLDKPKPALVEEFASLRKTHGACQAGGTIDAENALRGTYKIPCERGFIEVSLTLAPTSPAKVQFLLMRSGFPAPPALVAAGDKLVSMLNRWDDAAARDIFDPQADLGHMKSLLASTRETRGACQSTQSTSADGARRVNLSLSCEKYPLVVDVVTAEGSSKIQSIKLLPPPGLAGRCAG